MGRPEVEGEILKREIGLLEEVVRAKRSVRIPVVFNRREAKAILDRLEGTTRLMAGLLYGSGLRLMECLRLRVKDVDFEYHQIIVRDGKGQKDRVTMLPQSLEEPLKIHLKKVKALHERDLAEGFGTVFCHLRLKRSTPTRIGSGAGSMFFLLSGGRSIRAAVRCGGTILPKRCCSGGSKWRSGRQGSTNRQAAIPSAIRLQRICWRTATTSERFRNDWGIKTSAPR